jgi:hypothetical protein
MTDQELLKIYMWGFEDELTGETRLIPQELLATKAYALGKIDALIGDDVRSVDYQTDEQILYRIKN